MSSAREALGRDCAVPVAARVHHPSTWVLALTFALAWIGGACQPRAARPSLPAPPPPLPPVETAPAPVSPSCDVGFPYVVKKGDTLKKIARDFTGNPENWRTLATYNGIAQPNWILVGQKILIPECIHDESFRFTGMAATGSAAEPMPGGVPVARPSSQALPAPTAPPEVAWEPVRLPVRETVAAAPSSLPVQTPQTAARRPGPPQATPRYAPIPQAEPRPKTVESPAPAAGTAAAPPAPGARPARAAPEKQPVSAPPRQPAPPSPLPSTAARTGQTAQPSPTPAVGAAAPAALSPEPRLAEAAGRPRFAKGDLVQALSPSGGGSSDEIVARSSPNDNAPLAGYLNQGDDLTVLEISGSWVKVALPEGPSGWVRSENLESAHGR